MGCQAGCKVPIKGLLNPGAPLLAIRPSVLELQFWNDPMDPVIVGGDPDVDAWAVPAGAALTPADDPSLQPRLAFEAHQRAPRVSLQRKQRHCQSAQGPRSQQAHRWTYTSVFLCPSQLPALQMALPSSSHTTGWSFLFCLGEPISLSSPDHLLGGVC